MNIPLHRVDPKTGAWVALKLGDPIPEKHIRIEEQHGVMMVIHVKAGPKGEDITVPHVHGTTGHPVLKEHFQ